MPEAPGVYIQEFEIGAKPIEGVSTSVAGFVGLAAKGTDDKATLITSWGQFVETFGRYDMNKAPYLPPSVYGFFANGGAKCYVVKVKDDESLVGTDGGPGNRTGLNALNEIDDVSIVCIPGVTKKEVQSAAIKHCEQQADRVCILDTEKNADIAAAKKQRDDVISDKGYAALYYPWINVPVETVDDKGKVTSGNMDMPPSGYVAGIYARSDTERGVHKAPANEKVNDALGLKFALTQTENGDLNVAGVNCIRAFPGRGIRVWGARTTSSDILWRYVNVRRLFLYLEESIQEGTQWVVFEPNDVPLWARIRQSVTQFLTTAWRNGSLMGATPEEAFFVKCDRSTMTDDDVSKGMLICVVGVAPVKPAEFVIFRIAQLTASAKA